MSAQVCSPGLAPAPTRSVTQAPLGCPGPCPAPAGASHTGTFHSTPLPTARLIHRRRPGSSDKSEGFRRQQAATRTHSLGRSRYSWDSLDGGRGAGLWSLVPPIGPACKNDSMDWGRG